MLGVGYSEEKSKEGAAKQYRYMHDRRLIRRLCVETRGCK
jgi:hypothetical protein